VCGVGGGWGRTVKVDMRMEGWGGLDWIVWHGGAGGGGWRAEGRGVTRTSVMEGVCGM